MLKNISVFNEINQADVISFDVFDTLITRPFIKPRDLLMLLAMKVCKKYNLPLHPDKYLSLRMVCEREARAESGCEDISLQKIYDLFAERMFLDEKLSNALMQEEIEIEIEYSQPREEMRELYEYAKNRGKHIYFVSDMYLDTETLIVLLKKNNYDANWNNTLVSSFYGVTKHSGALFQILKDKVESDVQSGNILHIGDNFNADIKGARSLGIKAYFCENPHEEFLKIPEIKAIFKDNVSGRDNKLGINLMLGLCAKKFMGGIHPNIFYDKNSLLDGKAYNLGYFGVGLFLLNFSLWIMDYAKKNQIKNLIFLARDGYLLNEVYKVVASKVKDAPPSRYLLSSRRMFSIPSIFDKKDLNLIFNNNYEGTVFDFVKFRLGLEVDAGICEKLNSVNLSLDSEISTLSDILEVRTLVDALSTDILLNAERERVALRRYVKDQEFIDEKCALVDLGYNGSISLYFNKIFSTDFESLNVAADAAAKERIQYTSGLEVKGWLIDSLPFTSYNFNLLKIIPLLETIFSTKLNQSEKIVLTDDGFKEIFIEDENSSDPKRIKFVTDVHAGAIEFVKDFIEICGDDIGMYALDPISSTGVINRHFNKPKSEDIKIWDGIYFENNFAGWKNKAIFSSSGEYKSLWGNAFENKEISVENKSNPKDDEVNIKIEGLVDWFFYKIQSEKKYLKYKRNKAHYFNDAKNPIFRKLGLAIYGKK
ncbi:MAG: HAD-IA family hydrolase [Acidovorax sp.]|jgi:HAD superfamily hydrolase (TIGR01549 family)|nr:HAD-IA family hydrolase [Acidovorax sp.]